MFESSDADIPFTMISDVETYKDWMPLCTGSIVTERGKGGQATKVETFFPNSLCARAVSSRSCGGQATKVGRLCMGSIVTELWEWGAGDQGREIVHGQYRHGVVGVGGAGDQGREILGAMFWRRGRGVVGKGRIIFGVWGWGRSLASGLGDDDACWFVLV